VKFWPQEGDFSPVFRKLVATCRVSRRRNPVMRYEVLLSVDVAREE